MTMLRIRLLVQRGLGLIVAGVGTFRLDVIPVQERASHGELSDIAVCEIPVADLFACRDMICKNVAPFSKVILSQITDLIESPCNLASLRTGFFVLGHAGVDAKSINQ